MKLNEKIITVLFLVSVMLAAGCTSPSQKAPAQAEIVCNVPYIQVGKECCLDGDNNSICDNDEKTTTLEETTVASTVESTTTAEPTTSVETTTSTKFTCTINADCGGPNLGQLRCYQEKVVQDVTSYRCSKPGTADSKCMGSIKTEIVETCAERCLNGQCTDDEGVPVSSTKKCAWGKDDCTAHCNSQCTSRGQTVLNCVWDESACKCTAYCQTGTTPTTSTQPTTTAGATTSTPTTVGGATTSTPTTSVQATTTVSVTCGGSLYNDVNCGGNCDAECEECSQYQSTPCNYCKDKDCSTLGGALVLKNYTECIKYCNDPDVGYCKQWDTCSHCYYCYEYECGNDVVEPGEECESDFDCEDIDIYLGCESDCLCYPNCQMYCDDQGVNGYQWINTGVFGAPVINTQQQCKDWASQKLQQITQNCKTSCVASAFYEFQGETCCCVDWNSLPCQNCPGQNPVCPPADPDCLDTL
ncbi:MAG: hypothetical protein V1921_03515 [Candidatus Altiarchaeota archaeon]